MKRFALIAFLCLVGGSVIAQDAAPTAAGDFLFDTKSHIRLGRGDVTWTASASMVSPMGGTGSKDVAANGLASLGYFLSDEYELEGFATLQKAGSIQGASVGAGVNMYFREFFDNTFPYVGISASQWMADFSDQGMHVQAKVGVRRYFTDNLGLRLWVEYDHGDYLHSDRTGMITAYVGVFSMSY
ncbi:MAG: hypothetical protein WCP86_03000 [bacterium]